MRNNSFYGIKGIIGGSPKFQGSPLKLGMSRHNSSESAWLELSALPLTAACTKEN